MGLNFYDLEIWKEGFKLLQEIYKITRLFPKEELYSLIDQLLRSANSIIANIAEAHGRYYYADKIRVLYIVRGELNETRSHLRVAFSRNYLTEDQFKKIDSQYQKLEMRINIFINSLKSTK